MPQFEVKITEREPEEPEQSTVRSLLSIVDCVVNAPEARTVSALQSTSDATAVPAESRAADEH